MYRRETWNLFILAMCILSQCNHSNGFSTKARQSRTVRNEYTRKSDSSKDEARTQEQTYTSDSSAASNLVESLLILHPVKKSIDAGGSLHADDDGVARCGVTDEQPAHVEGATKRFWKTKFNAETRLYHVTYSILSRNTPRSIKLRDFQEHLLKAMCSWELVSNVRFENLGIGNSRADVTAQFHRGNHGDEYPFDGPGATLAHAFYPEDGRMHFDVEEDWLIVTEDDKNSQKKDIYSVTLHELGHILGLMHSDNPGAIMSRFYRVYGTFQNFDMPKSDRESIWNMYGSRKLRDPCAVSACRELQNEFGIYTSPVAVTCSDTRETCEDDTRFVRFCGIWKNVGYCETVEDKMRVRCKKTCGFCVPKS